jgi:hypothetical protein
MRPGPFSTSACWKHFAITSIAQQTAANPGWNCNRTVTQGEGTRNGLLLIRPTAQGTVFNTRLGVLPRHALAGCSAAPPMAGLPGRLRSISLTLPGGERSMLLVTAISSLAAETAEAASGAFARATHRLGIRRQPLIRLRR